MSYYLIDFTQDKNDFNFENLIIGKKINTKHYLYYQNIIEQTGEDILTEPKEIYIKLPKIRSIYKLGLSKYNQEIIPLYPHYNLLDKFILFIKNLEDNIHECFIRKYPDIALASIINKKNNINHIKVNIAENYFISSSNNKKMKMEDIKINSELNIVIKLSYVWNKDNNKIGLSCELYQIKYEPSPYDMNINFFENINITKIDIKPEIKKHNEENNHIPSPITPPKGSLVPSIADLQFAIKKLKPAKSD
jgi:hypothetical protein